MNTSKVVDLKMINVGLNQDLKMSYICTMMIETVYGKTWWGRRWLQPLLEWDDKQCLAKGEKYAQNGAVVQLTINEQYVVEATVLDFGKQQYQQQLKLRPLSSKDQEKWLKVLKDKPNWMSALFQQKLQEELAAVDEQMDTNILSYQWADWGMACSCSTKKTPCKHLVAVLLILGQRMDRDPLCLFQLRGLNLLQRIENKPQKESVEGQNIHTLASFGVEHSSAKPYDMKRAAGLDFSNFENQLKRHFQLLPHQTLFYEGNLKRVLAQKTKKAYRFYQKQNYDKDQFRALHQQLKQTKDLALIIDANNQVINLFALDEDKHIPLFASDRVLSNCVILFETIEAGDLPQYSDAFIALYTVYRFCIKLLQTQNFLPRLVATASAYLIQWIPAAAINPLIKKQVEELSLLCPSDLLLLESPVLKRLEPQEQIFNLCHLWLSYFIQAATELSPEFATLDKNVEYCFLSGKPTDLSNGIAKQIQSWLQPFYLGQKQYAPILKIKEVEEEEKRGFFITIQVEDKRSQNATIIDLNTFLKNNTYQAHHYTVLQELNHLVDYYPDLEAIWKGQKDTTQQYSPVEFERIFFEILPILRMLNISIVLPKSLQQLTRPRLGVSIGKKKDQSAKGKSFMNIKSLLTVKWKVVVGDEMMEAMEFLKLLKGKEGLIKHKERYIHLDKADLDKILAQLETPPIATVNQIIQAVLSTSFDGYKVAVDQEIQALFKALRGSPIIAPPQTLKATLRPYQQVGYSWMYKNAQLNLGSLIADDMGLGKTLQVISLLLKFKEEGYFDQQQALVIVPTSLLTNWMNEIKKFAPLLTAMTYHGANRKLSTRANVIITTYGIARIDLNLLNQLDWYCTVIDEAQHIKNANTAQTDAVKSIQATINIAMSGTPVENRLKEYWSIMDYVNSNYLGSMLEFTTKYSDPIEKDYNQERLEAFRKATAPFILRRLKSDRSIIQDLPDKIEQNYEANLQPIQTEIYQKIVHDTLRDLSQFKDDKKKRQGLILKLMGGLKQVCNHPYQYLNTGGQGPEQSGKGQRLMDLLARIQVHQEKTLIFTQYRKMGNLMLRWIKERFGFEPMYLHGGCSRTQRDAMVDAFQNDRQQRIFILSLKAAGTGLNLTAANHVIHYDLWWNPAVEAQATDRAYRIGQKKNVQVYRFITKGTLEEKIDAMIQSKKALANMTVALGEQWLGDLPDEALEALLVIS
ncbi:SNF2-related protein [Aureispira anguillae]|uniref:SNF2-related protein n=1 Tax=Aureispira anguillae TaxID=2864201 RepID=A0A916DU05_9BACT|nr:SNF2-related protein [Aureispira anguillae]BDS12936.1 SNF2-related protein [Aureispira anguillae]